MSLASIALFCDHDALINYHYVPGYAVYPKLTWDTWTWMDTCKKDRWNNTAYALEWLYFFRIHKLRVVQSIFLVYWICIICSACFLGVAKYEMALTVQRFVDYKNIYRRKSNIHDLRCSSQSSVRIFPFDFRGIHTISFIETVFTYTLHHCAVTDL